MSLPPSLNLIINLSSVKISIVALSNHIGGGHMINLILTMTISAILLTLNKGNHMELHVDKIDVKKEQEELVSMFYRIELRNFVRILLNECP